jgi:succinate-semialdehyde dehydrogenase/glutarate-semialdehyde dehydrogenase
MAYATTNPYTNELLKTFPDATDAEVDEALDKAHAAFLTWRTTSFDQRAKVLFKAAELARARKNELATLNTLEMGKLYRESLWEVEIIAQIFEYYAKNGQRLLAPERLEVDDPAAGDAVVLYQPLGIVLEIEPWNVPFFQVVRPLAPQLMAGNVVLLKHASIVPQCAAAIETLMRDAGLPDGVFTNLYATHAQTERIIADPRVCGVTLTGSEAAGATVAALAGQHIKKSVLELGGSDAMLVLDDADIDQAVRGAILGRLTLSGQACVGDKRMIVADAIYDEFVTALTAAVEALQPGDPMDASTTLAPVSSQGAADTIREQSVRQWSTEPPQPPWGSPFRRRARSCSRRC